MQVERVKSYLDASTEPKVTRVVETELVLNQARGGGGGGVRGGGNPRAGRDGGQRAGGPRDHPFFTTHP